MITSMITQEISVVDYDPNYFACTHDYIQEYKWHNEIYKNPHTIIFANVNCYSRQNQTHH